jgi:hypothetical protein
VIEAGYTRMAGDVELGATGDAAELRFNRTFSLSRGYGAWA